MSLTLNGFEVFCMYCGSTDLAFRADMLMQSLSGSVHPEIIGCSRCGTFFSKEFIEVNLALFTSDDARRAVVLKKIAASARYDRLEDLKVTVSPSVRSVTKSPKRSAPIINSSLDKYV